MTYFKYISIALASLICTISCKKDFLNVPDNSFINRQSYVKDLKSTEELLNGTYVLLGQNLYSGVNIVYPDLIADNVKPVAGAGWFANHYSWKQRADMQPEEAPNPQSLAMNASWVAGYRIIRSCNSIIESADKYRDQNLEKADDIKAQAYALRALVHLQLVSVFAQSFNFTANGSHTGIPYVTTSDVTQPVKRESVGEVFEEMINDLNIAIPLFKMEKDNALFMNRNAAKALLARIYLFKQDFLLAKGVAGEIAREVPIMNGSSYPSKLFTHDETESLFQLPPVEAGVGGAMYSTFFTGTFLQGVLYSFTATSDIAELLREFPQDVRNDWIVKNGGNWDIKKYPTNVIPGFSLPEASHYQTLLRSSEMYLILAESYSNLNSEDSARFYLNAIRNRAGLPSIDKSIGGKALLDSVYKERRKELAFEGLRMFDLLRWKEGVYRKDAPDPAAKNLPYPSDKSIAPIPIPDVNIAGLNQNAGY